MTRLPRELEDIDRWLRPKRVAREPGDVDLLRALALDVLEVVALDPTAPSAVERARAAEVAIATYQAVSGDWTLAQTTALAPDAGKRREHDKAAWNKVITQSYEQVRYYHEASEETKRNRRAGRVIELELREGGRGGKARSG